MTKYYYIGSSRVAMRRSAPTGTEVTYLHTDHLGTVSIATNQSQTVLARTLNMPYGGVRWTSSTMPTDWGYTGQKEPIGTGLVYLNARFYAHWTGRFVSADTIVPHPGKPQDLNRYSYTRNNPLRYVDPSGHFLQCHEGSCYDDRYSMDNPWITSDDASVRRLWLSVYAFHLADWASQGWISSLEALAQLSDFAVSLIPTNADNRALAYVNDMSAVLLGAQGPFVLTDALLADYSAPAFGDTGFHQDYSDGQNQPYHFWAYVATIANANDAGGWLRGHGGNIYHEFFDVLAPFDAIKKGGQSGLSWEDFHLGLAGLAMGKYLQEGTLPIERAGDYMRLALSTEFPGTADDFTRSLGTNWWPSKTWERTMLKITNVFDCGTFCWRGSRGSRGFK